MVKSRRRPESEIELPAIGAPAQRALASVGVTRLEELPRFSEDELMELHGFGPKALRILKEALREQGLSLSGDR